MNKSPASAGLFHGLDTKLKDTRVAGKALRLRRYRED